MNASPAVPATRASLRWIAWILLAVGALFVWFYLRGTLATAKPVDPRDPREGVVSQLALDAQGAREVRTSVVIPVPVSTAWRLLSDYAEWERLFKTVRLKREAEPLEGNRKHVVSDIMTPLGTLQLDFIVTHEELAEGGYRASWDAPTRELVVNKGEIVIRPVAEGATLFVYSVQKRYRSYPEFLINNMLLNHQTDVVETLRRRMVEIAREP